MNQAIPTPQKSTVNFRILALLIASALVNMTASVMAPILPALTQFFSEDPEAVHWIPDLVTFPGLFTIIGALATGWAIDHWGRLGIFRFGLIIYAIGGSSGAICSSIAGLFVGRIIIGVATGIIFTTSTALIAGYFSGEQRRKIIGWQMCAIGIGGVSSILLSGFLADISWRLSLGIYLFALVVLVCSYSLYEPKLKAQTAQSAPTPPIPLPIKKTLVAVLSTGVFLAMSLYVIYTHLTLHIDKIDHLSPAKMSLLLIMPTLFLSAASLLYPQLKKHFSFAKMHALGFFISGCGYLPLLFFTGLLYDAVGFAIIGIGMGISFPNLFSWVNFATPEVYRGRANGALTTVAFGGQFLTPLFFGQFFHLFPYKTALMACIFCLWVLALLYLGLPRKYSEIKPTD